MRGAFLQGSDGEGAVLYYLSVLVPGEEGSSAILIEGVDLD